MGTTHREHLESCRLLLSCVPTNLEHGVRVDPAVFFH
jgi:hypothetical protein